ncbi:DNA alkylation repair protein [Paenibacillus lignilyticus]|uniref:DNA alkylation repair protein n=1 Tax=Paenibacillus lignilyticus TaxID=1172615 RepID=A0ABS5CKE3_9BACL|nr:DNA alkylation repair protein [Paenibacillus lignilyticus]MBP3966344.1 DNA alkylation repair protein [Paenibacillus lignilyticus]
MAEPLKLMYDMPFLRRFAELTASEWPAFERERFTLLVTGEGWEELELKGRIRRITESLGAVLPASYPEALDVLLAIHERCAGFPYLFFPDFVERYGLSDWERSMHALEKFTIQSTAEFAIRPFLLQEPERTMARMMEWARSENEHLRRLASEGCRPRLPWAQALTMFKRDPSPIIPLLELLKCDPSLYVRKSVANNLNDIAKDHPDAVKAIAARWKGQHTLTDWIVRHGCRTLIKAADPEIMALFGYEEGAAENCVDAAEIEVMQESVKIGGIVEVRYALRLGDSTSEPIKLRIELGVFYAKAGGKVSQKRFLLSDKRAAPGTRLAGGKKLDFTDLTTRKHYPGLHRLELVVNGAPVAETAVMVYASADELNENGSEAE